MKTEILLSKVHLSIWDTAGQERFHALGPIYYRDSHGETLERIASLHNQGILLHVRCLECSFIVFFLHFSYCPGAILVYDITDEDSFHKVQSWVKELKKMLGADICLVIAGNKVTFWLITNHSKGKHHLPILSDL